MADVADRQSLSEVCQREVSRTRPLQLKVGGLSIEIWTQPQFDAAKKLARTMATPVLCNEPQFAVKSEPQQRPLKPAAAVQQIVPSAADKRKATPAGERRVAPAVRDTAPPVRERSSLMGQTVAVTLEFNPPRIFLAGDNSDDVRLIIADALWKQVPARIQSLMQPPVFARVSMRCAEPVFSIELPRLTCNELQQSAMMLEIMDAMEASPIWKMHVCDSAFELDENILAASEAARSVALKRISGVLGSYQQQARDWKMYHTLFFVHK
jgi:hypothetical protein